MKILLVILALSLSAFAQESLTKTELPTAPMPSQPASLLARAELPAPARPIKTLSTAPMEKRVVTKSFVLWTIADGATIAADAITTVHCLNLPNCMEKNPLFGSHPSTQRVASTESAFFATDTLISYWLKKKGKSWWWVPAMVNTAQGGIAAGLNLRHR